MTDTLDKRLVKEAASFGFTLEPRPPMNRKNQTGVQLWEVRHASVWLGSFTEPELYALMIGFRTGRQ